MKHSRATCIIKGGGPKATGKNREGGEGPTNKKKKTAPQRNEEVARRHKKEGNKGAKGVKPLKKRE